MEDALNNKEVNTRNYAIDILRIVSMLMIVSLHFLSYNSAIKTINPHSLTGVVKQILHSLSLVSVNCYILISGFYIDKFKFSLYKLLRIVCEVLFYSISLYLVFLPTNLSHLSFKELFFALLPTLTRQYWFVTTYVGVYLLSPIIRDIIKKLNRRIHSLVVFLGFMLFVLYYNLFFFCDNLNFGGSTGIVWFIYLYFCASYIKKYNVGKGKRNVVRYIICSVLALCSELPFVALYAITKKEIIFKGATVFNSVYNSIFVFASSILFFIIFANMKLYSIRSYYIRNIISFLAKSSFAVYLIHENKYMRQFLWNKLSLDISFNMISLIAYWIICVLGIYTCCAIIDWIRQIIEGILFEKCHNIINRIEKKLRSLMNYILLKI